jgi:putative spermidine/putrescine transport system permease protein
VVLGTWTSLLRIDSSAEMAAASLGASRFATLRRVVLPQAMPGILSGATIVFCLAASAFATPAIIGGRRLKVAATLVYDDFLNTLNWPEGAAVALLLLVLVTIITHLASSRLERSLVEVAE